MPEFEPCSVCGAAHPPGECSEKNEGIKREAGETNKRDTSLSDSAEVDKALNRVYIKDKLADIFNDVRPSLRYLLVNKIFELQNGDDYLAYRFDVIAKYLTHEECRKIVIKFIADSSDLFLDYFEKFSVVGLDEDDAIYLLDKAKQYTGLRETQQYNDFIISKISKFNPGPKLAYKLINIGYGSEVMKNIDAFHDLDHQELCRQLIEGGHCWHYLRFLVKLQGIDYNHFILSAIKDEVCQGDFKYAVEWFMADWRKKISGLRLNRQVFEEMLKKFGGLVLSNRDAFPDFSDNDIADVIIKNGNIWILKDGINKLHDLDKDVAWELFNKGYGETVLNYLDRFPNLDRQKYALCFIDGLLKNNYKNENINSFLDYSLEYFDSNTHHEIALKLIRSGMSRKVAENIAKFQGRDGQIGVLLMFDLSAEQVNNFPELVPDDSSQCLKKLWDLGPVYLIQEAAPTVKEFVLSNPAPDADISFATARQTHYLSPEEYLGISNTNPDALKAIKNGKPDQEKIAGALAERITMAGDQNIAEQLDDGVARFGAAVMLKYMNRPGVSRHDALFFMPQLLSVQSQVCPPNKFVEILLQVAKDNSAYEEGTAHHRLGSIVTELDNSEMNVDQIFEEAKKYPEIVTLQKLVADLQGEGGGAVATWRGLKKFYELYQLLQRTEILDELKGGVLSPKLRNYVETLAFHPNISTTEVIKFWKEPAEFLDIDDGHTAAEINRVKKPSNLISLPHLGLTAERLRDALVDGEMDDIQAIPPMEKTFYFGLPDKGDVLFFALRKALGERKQGIKGEAKNPRKLFSEAQAWCKDNDIQWEDLYSETAGPAVLDKLTGTNSGALSTLANLIFDKNFGVRDEKIKAQEYRARIGKKGDPDMVVAGNDTASCMPFGSGKNNVYMFNPTYAQFMLERKVKGARGEPDKWRMVAQSVMSIDHKTSTPTPELKAKYLQ
ncbi:MAG: hypothetical protein Q7S66_01760 [bacterium]|nr:hypothetical protein [bacterium]